MTIKNTYFHRADIPAVLFLLLVVAFAWCGGNAKWSAASWELPTAYLDAYRSDVMGTFAAEQIVMDGDFVPMARKFVYRLGAPTTANWNDFPIIEEFHAYFLGLLARGFGIFKALNIWMLLTHLTAAAAFYGVARYLKCTVPLAFVGGLAFGLAPFLFAQLPHHSSVAIVWHIPFFLLVWAWMSEDEGIHLWSGRFWFAVAVGLSAGLQNVYYTNIFCQLTLLGGVILALRQRSWKPLGPALFVIAAAAFAFGLMNLDTFLFRLEFGPPNGAVSRDYKWLEIYGLKFVDLFIPPMNHLSPGFAKFAASHRAESVLQDEGSYLGIVGILAFCFLAGSTAWKVIQRKTDPIPREAWQVLWILAMFCTGGLNAILGSLGFTLFRATGRYSIVILAIVLLYAVRQLSALSFLRGRFGVFSAVALSLVILWDQMPQPPSTKEQNQIAMEVASDRKFVAQIEAALPPGAMVFQLPIMEFPEGPVPGVSPYDHFRPYIYSDHLRFSFGTNKGRQDSAWQLTLAESDLQTAISRIEKKGFAALYINRNGFPDQAKELLENLKQLGLTTRIDSPNGDLVCLILPVRPSP